MRTFAYGLTLTLLLVTGAEAAVLCKKPSGAVAIRDTACKKKEASVDLATLGERDTLGRLSCATGQTAQWNGSAWVCAEVLPESCPPNAPLTWNGTTWACATTVSVPGDLSAGGNADLLGNGAADGRIEAFATGDPQTQTNASYDSANAARLPFYSTMATGTGDLTAFCRTGDLVVSGGCVVSNTCYLSRSYPIPVPTSGQSGWHCRGLNVSDSLACPSLTVVALCAKSF